MRGPTRETEHGLGNTHHTPTVLCTTHTSRASVRSNLANKRLNKRVVLHINPAHVPCWWMNNPTLGLCCEAMIGRADIEESKSNVAQATGKLCVCTKAAVGLYLKHGGSIRCTYNSNTQAHCHPSLWTSGRYVSVSTHVYPLLRIAHCTEYHLESPVKS